MKEEKEEEEKLKPHRAQKRTFQRRPNPIIKSSYISTILLCTSSRSFGRLKLLALYNTSSRLSIK